MTNLTSAGNAPVQVRWLKVKRSRFAPAAAAVSHRSMGVAYRVMAPAATHATQSSGIVAPTHPANARISENQPESGKNGLQRAAR
jgi:hypothetical protein